MSPTEGIALSRSALSAYYCVRGTYIGTGPVSAYSPRIRLIYGKIVCQSLMMILLLTGCGFLGAGNEEISQSRPGHTVYRAAGENPSEIPPPSTEKVPGESR